MEHHSQRVEFGAGIMNEAAKSTPPLTVVGATLAGFDVNALILWATAIYVMLQIAYLIWKWRREARGTRSGRDSG